MGVSINLAIVRRVDPLRGVIVPILSDEDTGFAALQTAWSYAGIFQRLPTDLHNQALLRIKAFRFAWRKSKELRVKLIDLVEIVSLPYIHFAGNSYFWIVMSFDIPTVTWNIPKDVAAGSQQFPEIIRRSYAAGITTTHANHGDRVAFSLCAGVFGKLSP